MGLLDNLKDQALKNANLNKLTEQALKKASELVDKAQEKLGDNQSENESPTKAPLTDIKPSINEQMPDPRKEEKVFEEKVERPSSQNQMFSKELEALIQATLEDGVLEDYEKAALVRRAQAEGVDLAELEIYINSILQRRKKEQARKEDERQAAIDQKKKEAFGRVCPNCGKQVPPLTLKCECGFEFTAKTHISSTELLSNKIDEIMNQVGLADDKINKICETIKLFPVPNSKEDIVDFLALSVPNARIKGGILSTIKGQVFVIIAASCIIGIVVGGNLAMGLNDGLSGFLSGAIYCSLIFGAWGLGIYFILHKVFGLGKDTLRHNKKAMAWRSKFDQVMIKARSLRGDPEFTQQLDYYENLLNKK